MHREGPLVVAPDVLGHGEHAVQRRLLVRLEAVLALGRCLDAADHHVGGVRAPQDRVEGERAGQPAHHPADRGIAEILVGDEGIHLDEVAERPLQPLLGPRPEEIVLVEAVERHHRIDRRRIEREQDEGLGLLPGAVAPVQHQERLAIGADVSLVQLLLEVARRGRGAVLAELGGDRSAGQQDDVAVGALDHRKIVTEQADVVHPRNATGGIGMMDERHVRVRIERVDVAARGSLRRVADVGVLGPLVEFGGGRVAAIFDVEPGNGGQFHHGQGEDDADDDRYPTEDPLLHRPPIIPLRYELPARHDAASPASGCCGRRAATGHP